MKSTKKLLLTLIIIVLYVVSASAETDYDFSVDGLYYKITSFPDLTCSLVSGDNKYSGDITIPATVTYSGRTLTITKIGDSAFEECTELTSVDVPNTVTEIGQRAFYNDTAMKTATLPNSITAIGEYTFFGCSSLTSVNIPTSLKYIANCTFEKCSSLTSVNIPASVDWTGQSSFQDCTSLTSVTMEDGIELIGGSSFSGCSNLASLKLANTVTTIRREAFYRCTSLEKLVLPSSVTELYTDVFSDSGIKEIVTEDGSGNIGLEGNSANQFFSRCPIEKMYIGRHIVRTFLSSTSTDNYVKLPNLKEVAFGPNITSVAFDKYAESPNLSSIYLFTTTPPKVYDNLTNKQYMEVKVYVPTGTLATYQATDGWNNFWNMEEFDTTGIENSTIDETTNQATAIFDMQGRKLSSPQKGLNIIRYSDGTVRKINVK